jgi:hypothetical protein
MSAKPNTARNHRRSGVKPSPRQDVDFRNGQMVSRACTEWLRKRGTPYQWKDQ